MGDQSSVVGREEVNGAEPSEKGGSSAMIG